MLHIKPYHFFLSIILFVGCGDPITEEAVETTVSDTTSVHDFASQTTVEEAKGFRISYQDGLKYVEVFDPWQDGGIMHTYRLFPRGRQLAKDDRYVDVAVPVETTICLSTTHLGFMEALGLEDKILGVDETDYICHPALRERVKSGDLLEMGDLDAMKMEHLVDLWPDLIMVSPMEGSKARVEKMNEVGLSFVFNLEWQESNLIARAEWIKFVAVFYNQEDAANAHFEHIRSEYNRLKNLASTQSDRPVILPGGAFKGTWYMAAGESFVARLIDDAGGNYRYVNEPGTGSLSFSLEEVVDNFLEADVWLNPNGATSLDELKGQDDRYAIFNAFQNGEVYNCNARLNEFGSNDYWESGVAWPNRVLQDLIAILHPGLLPDQELYYYQQLE